MTQALRGAYTPLYASPQQIRNSDPDPRDDVYALGIIWYQILIGDLTTGAPSGVAWMREMIRRGVPKAQVELMMACFEAEPTARPSDATDLTKRLRHLIGESARPTSAREMPVDRISPLVMKGETIADPQVAASILPPLSQDILELQGRLDAITQTIELVIQGHHPDVPPVWQTVADRKTSDGQPLISTLERRIAENPSRRVAELCAWRTDVPPETLLEIINVQKWLVRLKQERVEVEKQLHARQMEDFQGILVHCFVQSEGAQFPIASWLKLQPQLMTRRYGFVENAWQLLQMAEQQFAQIFAERSEWEAVQRSNSAELYEQYLRQYPQGKHTQVARLRASALLRNKLLDNLEEKSVRSRYLSVRTAADQKRDEHTSNWALRCLLFVVLLTGAFITVGWVMLARVAPREGEEINAGGLAKLLVIFKSGIIESREERIALIIIWLPLVGVVMLSPPLVWMFRWISRDPDCPFPGTSWVFFFFAGTSLGWASGLLTESLVVAVLCSIAAVIVCFSLLLKRNARLRTELGPLRWWETRSPVAARKKYLEG